MINVVIADDDVHIVEQLSRMLTKEKDIRVIRTCSNGLDTIMSYNSLRPTALILDLDLPGIDGFGVLENIKAKNDIIIYSGSDIYYSQIGNVEKVFWVMKKTGNPETLVEAIRKINENKNADIYKELQDDIDQAFENLHFKKNNKAIDCLVKKLDQFEITYRLEDIERLGKNAYYEHHVK